MVKGLCAKRIFWLAITFFVIANLSLGNFIFAKQLKINAEDVERIKTALDMAQTVATVADMIISNKDLSTVLNTILKGGTTGADVTYGLVVLGALNEMDLVDLVVSGRYRDEAREYFNSVLDQTINLTSYWKGASKNVFSLIRQGSAVTPTTGLAAESVAILEKTMSIIVSAKVWLTVETYNGMWRYFQDRMGGDSHEDAWYFAGAEMGYVPDQADSNKLEGWWYDTASYRERQILQLEPQFAEMYERWASYVTPFGISEEYKKQVKKELNGVLIAAVKENANLVKNEPKDSLINKLTQQLEKLKEATSALVNKVNPFKAGIILNLPEEEPEVPEIVEPVAPSEELIEAPLQSIEIEPLMEEEIIIATTTIPELPASTTEPVQLPETEPEPEPEPLPAVPILEIEPIPDQIFCERNSGNPTRFRVLINEIAWMGTANSSNDEWVELKNVWGIPVKLSGWQLLDKDRQIKIIFGEDDIIPAGGYYLLERTDDDSMPDKKADLIYTGALSNTDEALYLFDDQCNIEDEILANPNWPSGDNLLKKPMARLDVLNWYAGVSTPASENSHPPAIYYSSGTPVPAPPPPPIFLSPTIFITEIYIGGEGNQKDDFVELYNPNSETISLTDYYIQRKTENAQDFSTYVSHELLAGKTIEPQNYFLIANASSTFATSADVVTAYPLTKNNILVLKDPKQKIIDQISANDPPASKSYGRQWSNFTLNYTENFEAQIPTPRAQNQNSKPVEENEEEEDNSLSVIINEIAWAGTKANSSDEWIELYNNATSSIDISGWRLVSSDRSPDITFPTSTIAASGFYLIERTGDDTISDIAADLIYTGALENVGEKLELLDSAGNLIDAVDCSAGWFVDDNSARQTMERINPLSGSAPDNWASNNLVAKNGLDVDGNSINGTPKMENSVAKSSTEVVGGLNITEDLTLTLLGSPYLVEGSINVEEGARLTIEPGVVVKFKHNTAWKSSLKVYGELVAIGSEAQKIVFTSSSTTPTAGDWEWLYFENASSTLKNVVIQYAGKKEGRPLETPPFTRGALYVDGGNIEINNSKIEESQTLGIWLTNSASAAIDGVEFLNIMGDWEKPAAIYIESGNPAINDSIFTNNNIGILVENFANPAIEGNVFNNNQIPIQINSLLPAISENTFNNNNYNGVYLLGLSLPDGQTSIVWREAGAPYIINTLTLVSGLTIQIEPGTIIKFLNNGRLNIEGSFEANGTASNKIVFTSVQDDEYGGDTNNDGAATQSVAGRWHYVYFAPSSVNPVLENVIVRYGGWYNVFQGGAGAKSGAVKADGATLVIKKSLFENNLYGGLELVNSNSQIQDTVFRGHTADYFWGQRSAGLMIENSIPEFKKVDFNSNYYGVYVESGDCPDLSRADFGSGETANSVNVFPSNCAP